MGTSINAMELTSRHGRLAVAGPQLLCLLDAEGQIARAGSTHPQGGMSADYGEVSDLGLSVDRLLHMDRDMIEVAVRDMERRRHAADVRRRTQSIVERTGNLVAMTDVAGRLIYLNQAGRALLGIDAGEDVSGMSALDMHDELSREKLRTEAFPCAMVNGSWMGRSVLRRRDGRHVETTQVIIAHKCPEGRHEGMSIIMHDMTEWSRGEQALRQSHIELRRLSAQLISVQENERRRIAADLHDGIGQSLSLLKLQVASAVKHLEAGATAEAEAMLKSLLPRFKDTMVEVRRLCTDLHPASLDDLGILATLSWFFREVEAACCGVAVEKEFSVREVDVHPSLRIAIFRILQEAVSNIVKHAAPKRIGVTLQKLGDRLHLRIEDDGCGFDPSGVVQRDYPDRGFGLSSMKERAKLSGGDFELRSAVGQGTRIQIIWPAAPHC